MRATRVAMALLHAAGVNPLVLDEPTNHLDHEAIEQLEQALDAFDGTMLLVTHERRTLDTVRLTRRWHVDGGRVSEIIADCPAAPRAWPTGCCAAPARPEPWFTRPGFIVGIPAMPWLMPFLLGAVLLRRAGASAR